ncbi:methylated-DNA--[protein]-cysteine S-methyltransferase [Corynebacterium sp. 320]|uniref:methylated-DNA--[protein]-cysteine S-methyltransferase n=1 Tax=Corynebacterium TaxID=1716 RepID=UPI00125CBD6E|nr:MULTISPECIES: methylated-DNA--[protein]-cysteine S-methyltransferase [Corynebacterium]KAB1502552.1 methylated-DNA--[protein]-cysteine S-methyltransferase [Corynebacterium sp. 320]KAB1551945.1 methylated-DNA--[protein]-cysteine S-methyltransferase [Corynebacterium sp. 319]KAB3526159.1 methylated-DNA--[protein]-cysteine S-methyltransferase [Corynebacterium sp. 250]KAB3538939.1 methylated-DNA--[protein]-cysteine S-methyltransferase [Corynebacterium sp. 366]QNP92893.1 methylated-DNA--[protein]-
MAPRVHVSHFAEVPSPLGTITVATDGRALTGCWFQGQTYFPIFDAQLCVPAASHPILARVAEELREYFDGGSVEWTVPLAPAGTALQQQVWQQLRTIPRGETRTYGEIAATIGRPRAARAVGQAVGRNPLSIVVPCHRVVGADGALTGYAGGMDRKIHLLRLEGVLPSASV